MRQPGFQGRGAVQAGGDPGEDDGEVGLPKGLANRENPGVVARCWTVLARCLP
jgi:hypothetical protein